MMRQFNGRPLELLAPAGTFDIFRAVMNTPCDAIYCGGQSLNMRMIRTGYNLSDAELTEAVGHAHGKGKKIYITLNSLLDDSELALAEDRLAFLSSIGPDALIIQDAAILSLASRMKIDIPLHASVMMNIHNLDQINFYEQYGISRVVLSRELPLSTVRDISGRTGVELEYFVHGDMCVTHGSHCLYSSWVFGMSSNRGRCLKPCRWTFTQPGKPDAKPWPLAVKDMNMFSHLSDLVLSGITSFKIEGRMRQKEFITGLVTRYGEALDRFLDDPLARLHEDPVLVEEFRKRDFSTAYAFGIPGDANINTRGEGTGVFYSTGKVFSEPEPEAEIPADAGSSILPGPEMAKPLFSVRVDTLTHARMALDHGVNRIYVSAEPLAPNQFPSRAELRDFKAECLKRDCELYIALPRMMSDSQNSLFCGYLEADPIFDGVLASHAGVLSYLDTGTYSLVCDLGMNLYNQEAVQFYVRQGISGWLPSLELPWASLLALPRAVSGDALPEVLLHGRPTVMYMDHDVSGVASESAVLVSGESTLTIRRDYWNRYHLLGYKDFSLLPRLPDLMQAGYRMFRLDLTSFSDEGAGKTLAACRNALDHPERGGEILRTLKPEGGGFTYGAYQF